MLLIRPLLFLAMVLSLSTCMSWKRVPVNRISTTVQAKDTVRLKTIDGRTLRFVVTTISDKVVSGSGDVINIGDIDWLEKGKDEPLRTLGVVGLVVVGTALIIGIVAMVGLNSAGGMGGL